MQTCIWPSRCHCHSLSLASVKSRLVLPSWYRLTWVVPLNVCVCVCACVRACMRACMLACVCACVHFPFIFTACMNDTHTHPFNGPFSGTTRVSRYQKGKTNLDFTEARDSEWQWHQLGHMQICITLQTDNHATTSPCFFGLCSSLRET